MEGISDIKIIGIDETRPPRIRKEPYINLYFRLSHKAPEAWCDDFNRLVSKAKYPIKIDPAEGLVIETWVRKPEEIEPALGVLKAAITRCNEEFIANIRAAAMAASSADAGKKLEDEGEQGRLNRIIAGLKFDD
jgi:hypothetical protein